MSKKLDLATLKILFGELGCYNSILEERIYLTMLVALAVASNASVLIRWLRGSAGHLFGGMESGNLPHIPFKVLQMEWILRGSPKEGLRCTYWMRP